MKSLGGMFDERYRNHRLRAGCFGGIAGYVVANVLLVYRHSINHVWNSDLLIVASAISIVTALVMLWYLLTD